MNKSSYFRFLALISHSCHMMWEQEKIQITFTMQVAPEKQISRWLIGANDNGKSEFLNRSLQNK